VVHLCVLPAWRLPLLVRAAKLCKGKQWHTCAYCWLGKCHCGLVRGAKLCQECHR